MEEMPHLQITSSAPGNVEIISPLAGKGTALSHVASQLGLTRENVMAVGDAGNDLNMLEYAYHSVAMGNAVQQVKDAAGFVTKTNDEGGIAYALDKLTNP